MQVEVCLHDPAAFKSTWRRMRVWMPPVVVGARRCRTALGLLPVLEPTEGRDLRVPEEIVDASGAEVQDGLDKSLQ